MSAVRVLLVVTAVAGACAAGWRWFRVRVATGAVLVAAVVAEVGDRSSGGDGWAEPLAGAFGPDRVGARLGR